jgi:Tol biopolymer transport system component
LSLLSTSASMVPPTQPTAYDDTLLSTENAYNPIPSPDGKYIAYVRTGWGRSGGSGGVGRSNLVSEIAVIEGNGNLVAKPPVVDAFLSGWTPDGADLVCYRDGEFYLVSMNGKLLSNGQLPGATNVIGTERVSYLPGSQVVIWSQQNGFHTVLETPNGVLTKHDGWLGALIAASPDGRYVAIAGGWSQSHLWVYDIDLRKWTDLGDADIHPDREWDYIKPSWNPWFANSSRLAYFTHDNSILSISTPDGKQRTDIRIEGPAGLATPSPDGRFVAYVTFEPRPQRQRPDLQFWGGTRVWVVSLVGKPDPRPVTLKSLDETYDLRWLNDRTLVFDRVSDVLFYKQSRVWKATVPR